jgi:transposase
MFGSEDGERSSSMAGRMTIKQEWDRADKLDHDAEEAKWKVAKRLADANDKGSTLRQLAKETGRSNQTVGTWIKVHREFAAARGGNTFAQAFEQIKERSAESETQRKRRSHAKRALEEKPEVVIEDLPDETFEKVEQAVQERSDRTFRQKTGIDPDKAGPSQAEQAEKKTAAAHSNLGARVEVYGDVPVSEGERVMLDNIEGWLDLMKEPS